MSVVASSQSEEPVLGYEVCSELLGKACEGCEYYDVGLYAPLLGS